MTSTAVEQPSSTRKRSDRIGKDRGVKWQEWPNKPRQHDTLDPVSLSCRHPDLEDASFIAWGLEQSKDSKGTDVEVDVLYGSGTDLRTVWRDMGSPRH
jgi:hypothetical protein